MANSFANLKKSRSSSLNKLISESAKLSEGGAPQGSSTDDLIWKPTVDKAGNGYAVIRFLPEAQGEELPWVRMFDHGFQGPGGWYIENCPTTLGGECPLCKKNNELWNSGLDSNKEIARKQKRRLSYYSNILVVKDPSNPQNEGKVFLYKYGKKIWDKINDLMQPEFEDESPVNPFDFWEGADFKLKIRQVDGYRNYDKSEFDAPTELFDGDDEKLEEVYNSLNPLQDIVAPEKFKSFDELSQKLDRALGVSAPAPRSAYADDVAEAPVTKTVSTPKTDEIPWDTSTTDDDDDSLSFFEKLANE